MASILNTIASSPLAPGRAILLDSDILWLIFNMNADMFSDGDALETTRLSSQVCKDWRDFLLNTPSLWGKLIDLDALTQERDDWRNEVLRRSADTLLTIMGTKSLQQASCWIKDPDGENRLRDGLAPWQTFFFSVLDNHWSRIKRLTVNMDTASMAEPSRWSAVYSPAPCLRIFELGIDTKVISSPISLTSISPIFANDAPLLEIFHAINLKFHLHSSWLSTIRSIHVGTPFRLSETLDLLKMTPLLESLLVQWVEPDPVDDLSPISLPNLNQFIINANFETCVTLLGCMFGMRAWTTSTRINTSLLRNPDNLVKSLQVFSRAAEDYFTFHLPTTIILAIYSGNFGLEAETTTGSIFLLDIPIFATDPQERRGIMSHLLTAFTMPGIFQSITKLELKIRLSSLPHGLDLSSFFLSFPRIKILCLREISISDLPSGVEETSQILFPLLEIIKITKLRNGSFCGSQIRAFLCARRDARYPISILDLTECRTDIERSPSLGFLDEMKELKVLWH